MLIILAFLRMLSALSIPQLNILLPIVFRIWSATPRITSISLRFSIRPFIRA